MGGGVELHLATLEASRKDTWNKEASKADEITWELTTVTVPGNSRSIVRSQGHCNPNHRLCNGGTSSLEIEFGVEFA